LRWAAWTTGTAEEWSLQVEAPRPHLGQAAWRVAVSALRLDPPDADAPYKHLGRARWREALVAGRAAGCEEVLLADGTGALVEGAISNVFCVRGGALVTPAAVFGPLPGIVRAKVLELARREGLAAGEGRVTLDELPAAAEVFLTNSLAGIRPVASLDGRNLPAPGPVTLRLQAAWRGLHGWGG
jgi:branched-subunit amino acid aminotransferase/4-amino-4-deoxychorismate lyase